jgi:hypothetical protein
MLSFTTEPFGSTVTTHRVTTDAAIRLDDRPVSLEELQNGDYVRLTIENEGNELVITSIDALSMENSQPGRSMEPAHPVGGYDRTQDYPLPRTSDDGDPTSLERHR